MDLKYTSEFKKEDISLEDLSQILWAGYGNTPHVTYNGRGGLTVPSWYADYCLTGNIYVVKQDGIFRYHNRNPDIDKWYARLEAGFVGGNMLLQGSAIGVGCWFTTELSDIEKKSVREFMGIKVDDVPFMVVSVGYVK